MDLVLARDMQELREKYTPRQIVNKVRLYFYLLDGQNYNDVQLFLRAWRAYNNTNKGYEDIVQTALHDYRSKGEIPLPLVRCLLPGSQMYPWVHYEPAKGA